MKKKSLQGRNPSEGTIAILAYRDSIIPISWSSAHLVRFGRSWVQIYVGRSVFMVSL